MGFMKLMEEANYNFGAKKEGWIYSWTEKFVLENIEVLNETVIEDTLINLPPKEAYENSKELRIPKGHCEELLKEALQAKKIEENNKQRSAA